MNRLLILSYYFGHRTQRLMGLAKHLPKHNWEVQVVTADPENGNPLPNILPVSCSTKWDSWASRSPVSVNHIPKFIKKAWEEVICYPDPMKGWLDDSPGFEIPDVVLTSGPPHSTHQYGAELKRGMGIPWVADLRDLWTQNPYFQYGLPRKIIEQRLELRTLKTADALVTVSNPLADDLGELHNKPTYSIPNGFEPIDNLPSFNNDKLVVTHAGQLYDDKRDPSMVKRAIRDLDIEDKVQLNLLSGLSRDKVLEVESRSDVLLLLLWNDHREKGVFTGKIFEYLSMKRPILAIGPEQSVVRGLLETTNAGAYVSDTKHLKGLLKDWYLEWKTTGQIAYCGIEAEVNQWTHEKMARRYAMLLNRLVGQ